MTLLVEGSLVSIKFVGGVFETEDPAVIEAMANHPSLHISVIPVGAPNAETREPIHPVPSETPEAKPAPKRSRSPKKAGGNPAKNAEHRGISGDTTEAEKAAIAQLMGD